MATNQYPTYGMDTGMGMNRSASGGGVSNALRQGAQAQRTQGPTYSQPRNTQYGQGMTRQAQPYNQNVGQDMYAAMSAAGQQYNDPYGSSYGRGGGTMTRPYQPDPLPGQGGITREQSQYYNPTMPQYQMTSRPAQVQANQFGYYQGLDPTTMQTNDEREAAMQSVQMNVPIWQLQQNAYQYAQDANEANRRWQETFGYQQGLDQFNMGLASQQQAMAEWQAQQAASQWAQDYARQTGNDQWQQQFSQQQFGLQDYATREGLRQSDYTAQQNAAYQQGQLGLQQQANRIDEMYKSGQLDLGQRNAALAELTQAQNYGLQQAALAQQQMEQGRRFGLDERTQAQLEIYRQQQLAQEAALTREQMAAQQQIATMQAYGRNQRPNAKWLRAF